MEIHVKNHTDVLIFRTAICPAGITNPLFIAKLNQFGPRFLRH